jgi:hypothetical protein
MSVPEVRWPTTRAKVRGWCGSMTLRRCLAIGFERLHLTPEDAEGLAGLLVDSAHGETAARHELQNVRLKFFAEHAAPFVLA